MHDVFYFTDIHGYRPLFDAIMNYCREQDDEATIICGGDALDRGKDGYAIMKELLDNPKVVYLKGNHEDMFTKAAREIKAMFNFENRSREDIRKVLNACRNFDYKYGAIQDSLYNGGLVTLTDWILDGAPIDIVERIEHLPITFSYDRCDFCHSAGIYKAFSEAADKEYNDEELAEWDINYLIWTRESLDADWMRHRIAVLGHTPVPYLSDYIKDMVLDEDDIKPVKWGDPSITGEKLDMDTGAVFTGRAFVLNVLTMQAQGFEDKDFKNGEIRNHNVEKIEVIQF